jgi:excisionase family DNA binding protein
MKHEEVMAVNERLLTVEEVAERLQVPRTWVYKHLDKIPYIKLGKYLRFEPSQLDSLLHVLRRSPRES